MKSLVIAKRLDSEGNDYIIEVILDGDVISSRTMSSVLNKYLFISPGKISQMFHDDVIAAGCNDYTVKDIDKILKGASV